jgi:4-amino-4-deoxy-L-arabinose transferase-like glycosyltransferase
MRQIAVFVAIVAGLAVLLTLDDPGLTIDEPLDVQPGRNYVHTLWREGSRFFSREVVDRVYRDNAEHPPLGRWLLGIASILGEPFEILWQGADPTGQYVLSGRLAPALAFAALAGLVSAEAGRRWGRAAAWTSGIALAMMPRVFAHAHLAALDTFLALFWTAALLAADRALSSRRPIAGATAAGLVWSLALLTKIHAWFLLPIVAVASLWRLGFRRGSLTVAAWTAVGLAGFFAGWPWLWYETASRLLRFWGTGVDRASILVTYWGNVYRDRDVPWHYPWFYFAVSVPVGLQILGLLGLCRGWRERRSEHLPLLLPGAIVLFLALFSTNVPVYDGERLFLLVFPGWALLIGLGFSVCWGRWSGRKARGLLVALFALQGFGVIAMHPFGLSYYNAMVGGLPGAERLGLELTYWGDAVDRVLLDRLAQDARPGDSAAIAPTLYPGQGVRTTTAPLARRDLILGDEAEALQAEWVLLSRREAYWRPELVERLRSEHGQPVLFRSRFGVWLGALWHFPTDRHLPTPTAPNSAISR